MQGFEMPFRHFLSSTKHASFTGFSNGLVKHIVMVLLKSLTNLITQEWWECTSYTYIHHFIPNILKFALTIFLTMTSHSVYKKYTVVCKVWMMTFNIT